MAANIHHLQEATVHLLDALYKDKHLHVTKAMLSIQNGYYPDVKSILSTLHHYADEELVIAFTEKNSDLIERTKKEIEEQKAKNEKEKLAQDDESFDNFFGSSFKFIKPYELIKTTALVNIENAFSTELSRLCNEELVVSIDSLQPHHELFDSCVEMKITVKAKQPCRVGEIPSNEL